MNLGSTLDHLLRGIDLTEAEATAAMVRMIEGHATDVEIAGFLVAMVAKGAQGSELAAFARVLRDHAEAVPETFQDLVDTCGTGGGIPSFNISTAAALVAAAAGAHVAKHGNRAVTSKCGSADVLEALGVNLDLPLARKAELIRDVGVAFLFAPTHHPALRHVGPVRKQLGIRTIFNQLGPLANPAGARRQLIGVYDRSFLAPMAEALILLGAERALVVHGDDGLDEISPCGPASAIRVEGDLSRICWLTPADFGLEPIDPAALAPGETLEEAAAIVREALSEGDSLRAQAVLPSAAATLWLAGIAEDFAEGAHLAREAIRDGRALAKLNALIEAGSSA